MCTWPYISLLWSVLAFSISCAQWGKPYSVKQILRNCLFLAPFLLHPRVTTEEQSTVVAFLYSINTIQKN